MRRMTIGRIAAGGLAVCVLGAAGAGAASGASSTRIDGHYRTATAVLGDVTETLPLTGTIATASRRDEAFAVAGTVASVKVQVGDHVDAGDTLAMLDADSLEQAVDDAKDTVASAKQQLATDLAAQTASSSTGSAGSAKSSSTVSVDPKALQRAISALHKAQQALAGCDSTDSGSGDDSSGDSGDGGSGGGDATGGGDSGSGDGSDPSGDTGSSASSCIDTAEQQVSVALTTLQKLGSAKGSSKSAGTGAATSGTSSAGGSSSGATGGASAQAAGKPSAADIAADRARITAAQAQVSVAEQSLAAHVLTAGISGTVAAVGLAKGDVVSAGSASAVITIIGDDGYVITATVPLTKIAKVAADETATVTLPALGTSYDATVASVGVVDVDTSSSTPSYQVTIDVDAKGDTIRYGSAATVEVDVASATNVLTVPLSAVTTGSDGASTVEVLEDGKASAVTVTTGAVGSDTIEIDSGLSEGDEVVLADLDEAVPTSTTMTTRTRTGVTGLTGGTFTGGFGGTGGAGGFGGTGRGNG